jgi:hypothetical protein
MDLKMAEDDNMWMRVACHCVVELVDEPLAFIRSHPDRMSRSIPLHVESVKQPPPLRRSRRGTSLHAGPPELGPVAQTGV